MVLWDLHNPILPGKGYLISESFLHRLKSSKKVPNHSPEHYLFEEKMLQGVILHFFLGDLSQKDKLSEIKPPLVFIQVTKFKFL